MKYWNTTVTILLNILFCIALLWFFSRNAFLRPFLGSTVKEGFSGLLLLVILYANYYILYPKLYRSRVFLYWFSIVFASLLAGCVELIIGYSFIVKCNALQINEVGLIDFFSLHLFFVFCRNLAFNFFPFMFRERKQLQQCLENEVKIVYQYARLLDVCDKQNNCQHIPIDDIFYCKKHGNYTFVYTVNGASFTRYCSVKYLEQHLGNKEFIRISPSVIIPFEHIASCDGKTVVMKKMSWMNKPLEFTLDSKTNCRVSDIILEYLRLGHGQQENGKMDKEQEIGKRKQSVPPKDKLNAVLNYIRTHPNCRSTEIISHTSYSLSTMERCLAVLKKQGLIVYTGSKKYGGYTVVDSPK